MQRVSFVLGWILRRHQEVLAKPIRRYKHRPSDRFAEIELHEEIVEWISALNLPPVEGKFLVCIRPVPDEEIPPAVFTELENPERIDAAIAQLDRLESKIDFLVEFVDQQEAGKLRANLEYLLDFSNAFSYTLLMMYLRQVEYQSFATILEEIELQCAQVMSSIQGRNNALAQQIEDTAQKNKHHVDQEHLNGLIESLLATMRRWYAAIRARAIAAYLRVAIPRANRPFVYQQIDRMRADNREFLRLNKKPLNLFAGVPQSILKSTIESAVEELTLLHDEINELLHKPRRSVRELDQIVKQTFSYVVEIDKSNRIESFKRLLPKHQKTHEPQSQKLLQVSTAP